MKKMKWMQIALTASLLIMVSTVATQATVLRAFVSSAGNDANAASNCPQTTPCKTFAGAFPVVTPGGELVALDTSGYGPLTINKAITVAAVPGATAFVVAATGTSGFTVSAGATDLIVLRNINFNGSGAANTTGVQVSSGKVTIEDCKFAQLSIGINVHSADKTFVQNCSFNGNGTGLVSVTSKVTAENLTVSNNTVGFAADGDGGSQNVPPTGPTQLEISGGVIVNNGTAFSMANAGTHQTVPAAACNGVNIFLRGNSDIRGNAVFAGFSGSSDHQAGCGAQVSTGSFGNQLSPP